MFSLLAPFVLPIINQVKVELNTGSSEIIQSSKEKQLIVFRDDYSSDPTHSMLSKDHFSNILNEPAGKVASQVLKWVVPQLIACWDNESIDVNRTLTRIVNGVFHHPALRDHGDDSAVDGRRLMFGIVQKWWGDKRDQERDILRDQLSRDGVEQGRNHKEGVHDTGHGCGKPLGMPTLKTAGSSGAVGGSVAGGIVGDITDAFAGQSKYDAGYAGGGGQSVSGNSGGIGKLTGEAVGGGALGGIVGGIAGAIGGDLLGGAFDDSSAKKQTYQRQHYEADGSYTQSVTQTGYNQPQRGAEQVYGQAEYSQTSYSGGGQRQEYQRYEQGGEFGQSGYGQRIVQDSRPTYGGGYETTTETSYEQSGGDWRSDIRREGRDAGGEYSSQTNQYSSRNEEAYRKKKDSDSDSDSDSSKKHTKKHHKHHDDDDLAYGRQDNTYEYNSRQEQSSAYGSGGYGNESRYEEPRRSEHSESGGYGGYGRGGDEGGYGARDEYGGRSQGEYGGGGADERTGYPEERYGETVEEEGSYGDRGNGRGEGEGEGYGEEGDGYSGGRY